ncbi:MAG: tyrosine-type recombinase/integrase, partial [Desulfobacterales bacterium]
SELFRAQLSDVDLGRKTIRLWTRKRQGGAWEHDILPMTVELARELTGWIQRRLAHATADKKYLFVCLSPQPVNERYFGLPFLKRSHVMARWCKQAEVTRFGWHAIRHLTASTLYRRGYSVSHIQAVLRHKSATTTSRYLRSLGIDEVRDTLDQGLTREDSRAQIIPFQQQKKTASGPTS